MGSGSGDVCAPARFWRALDPSEQLSGWGCCESVACSWVLVMGSDAALPGLPCSLFGDSGNRADKMEENASFLASFPISSLQVRWLRRWQPPRGSGCAAGNGPSPWGRTIPRPLLCFLPSAPGYFEVQGLSLLVGPPGPLLSLLFITGGHKRAARMPYPNGTAGFPGLGSLSARGAGARPMHAVAFQHFPCGISGCRGGTEMFAHVCMSLCACCWAWRAPRSRVCGVTHTEHPGEAPAPSQNGF